MALELLDISLELCNDFLTFPGALGKLFLDLFVQRNVPLEHLYLLGHLVTRLDQLLRVFRLVVKFSGELMVLKDSEAGLGL